MTNNNILILLTTIVLASCGGGSGDQSGDQSSQSTNVGSDGPSGELFELGGVQYSSQAAATDTHTVQNSAASGTTPSSGEFHFGYSVEQVCTTVTNSDGSAKQVCSNNAPVTSPVVLSICGKVITTINDSRPFPLTIWDLFPDQQSIDNFTSVALMGNTNSGDPLSTGIKIGLPTSGCQTDWSWATADIQHDAASFRDAVTPTNGTAPSWPSLQTVRDYETASYRCARAGLYASIRHNNAKAPNVSDQFQGSMFVLVDLQGHISGAFDFSVSQPEPLYPGVMTFSADYAISPGGTAPFAYSASSADSIPNLQISGQLSSDGINVQYHTADNSLVSQGDGLIWPYSYLYTPVKYRFLARDLQYPARTGYPGATETLALTLDIGTDNKAEGNFFDFPSLLPTTVDVRPGGLLVRGTLNGNTLTLHYVDDEILGPPSQAGNFSLTFDSVAKTLAGRFPTYDGKSFVTFGSDRQPLQGCGPSLERT